MQEFSEKTGTQLKVFSKKAGEKAKAISESTGAKLQAISVSASAQMKALGESADAQMQALKENALAAAENAKTMAGTAVDGVQTMASSTADVVKKWGGQMPDFMSYADGFSDSKFVRKIKEIAFLLGSKLMYVLLVLWHAMKSPSLAMSEKMKIIGSLGYLIVPMDLVPDVIAGVGYADDISVVMFVFKAIQNTIDDDVIANAKADLAELFPSENIDKELET